jgi:hypothetical protein
MAKPELQSISLMASLRGLSAWVDGKYLGTADVIGDKVTIEVMAKQVERGLIFTDTEKLKAYLVAHIETDPATQPTDRPDDRKATWGGGSRKSGRPSACTPASPSFGDFFS